MLTRIIGLDMEYGCAMIGEEDATNAVTYLMGLSDFDSEFLPNGGRFYRDMGHPEYATPECLDPFEATRYHFGFDIYLNRLRARNLKQGRIISVFRDNIDPAGTSFGCHENYLMKRSVQWAKELAPTLVPFLVSRTIFCGSGHVDMKGQFHQSQRATVLDEVEAYHATEGDRSILNSRDEHLLLSDMARKYRRLHLTIGDANFTHWSNLLKLGVTSIVLSMIEAGMNLSFLYPDQPIIAMQTINADTSLKRKVLCKSRRAYTALDMQRYFCDSAERFIRRTTQTAEVPGWMSIIWTRWADVLDKLVKYKDQPWGSLWSIDWILKRYWLDLYRQEYPRASAHELLAIAMDFHTVNPEKSLVAYMAQEYGLPEQCFRQESLATTITTPPRFPRAIQRGNAVSRGKKGGRRINWDGIWLDRELEQPFDFPDIFR